MSFPKIPDINPYINITFEDAINLLLTSIAMEEVSLSKLMDAETHKILCVLDHCKHDNCKHDDCCHHDCNHQDSVLHDAIEINKSVDDTIKNSVKLQMLLQFKLENIKELLPATSSSTTTSTSTSTTTTCTKTTTTKSTSSTTTTTHTTTCTTSTCSTTTKKECSCSLTGNGIGCIANRCDGFYNELSALYAFVYCHNDKNRAIRYSVGNDDANLHMYASGHDIEIQCPGYCSDKLVIYGKGYAEKHKKGNPDIASRANFILTVCKKANDILEFRIEIISDTNPQLNHDSGFVQVKNANSNLSLIICC